MHHTNTNDSVKSVILLPPVNSVILSPPPNLPLAWVSSKAESLLKGRPRGSYRKSQTPEVHKLSRWELLVGAYRNLCVFPKVGSLLLAYFRIQSALLSRKYATVYTLGNGHLCNGKITYGANVCFHIFLWSSPSNCLPICLRPGRRGVEQ